MRRAGTVRASAQGVLVLESADGDSPAIGTAVLDSSLDVVGRVVDVIGPVTGPLLVVSPADDRRPADLLDERLYLR